MVQDITDYGGGMSGKIRGVQVSSKRNDGWKSLLSGQGGKSDKTESTFYNTAPSFDDRELSNMYRGEGMAKRIIDLQPNDATREWISFVDDPQQKLEDELKRLGAKTAFRRAMSWARLYRGSIIVMVEKGVSDLTKPLSATSKGVDSLRVYSAARIEISSTDIITDPSSPYFEEIEMFTIRMRSGALLQVHASRCLIFKGEEAPDDTSIDFKYLYWGLPVIESIYDRLKNWGSTEKGIANLMLEFNIGKYTISNLANILAQNTPESLELIYNRMDIINASKSIINAVLLGEDESYDRDSASLGGVDAIMDRMIISLSAVANYPVTRLFGRSPAGQNATGESDMRQYYDDVSTVQETWLEPPLQKLINRIAMAENVSNADFEFNSLWQLTEKEQAEVDKLNAETDQIYMDKGVVYNYEVRENRFPKLDSVPLPIPGDEEITNV